jgi:hypothetical protein
MKVANKQESVTGAASTNSTAIAAAQFYSASFLCYFTGSDLAGTFKIQACNDQPVVNGNKQDPTNWADIPSATVSVTAAGAKLITISAVNYQWLRWVWTKSGGTGDLGVAWNAQSF